MFFDHQEFSILDMIAISEDKVLNVEDEEAEIVEVDQQVFCEDDMTEDLDARS